MKLLSQSQVDMLISFASMTKQKHNQRKAIDCRNFIKTILGKADNGCKELIEDAGTLAIVSGNWKYIEPGYGPAVDTFVNIRLGNSPLPQLYNLKEDIGEKRDLSAQNPLVVATLKNKLEEMIKDTNSKLPTLNK